MTFIQGRCIRCEPAKAHRTLLVSFCPSPSPTPLAEKEFTNIDIRTGLDPADKFPEWVRIRRPDSRTQSVFFLPFEFDLVVIGLTSWKIRQLRGSFVQRGRAGLYERSARSLDGRA